MKKIRTNRLHSGEWPPKSHLLHNLLVMPNREGFERRASIRANGLQHSGEWVYSCACSFLFDQVLKANFKISRHLGFRGYIYPISVEIPRQYFINPKTFLQQISLVLSFILFIKPQLSLTCFTLISSIKLAIFLVYLSSTTMDSTFYIY